MISPVLHGTEHAFGGLAPERRSGAGSGSGTGTGGGYPPPPRGRLAEPAEPGPSAAQAACAEWRAKHNPYLKGSNHHIDRRRGGGRSAYDGAGLEPDLNRTPPPRMRPWPSASPPTFSSTLLGSPIHIINKSPTALDGVRVPRALVTHAGIDRNPFRTSSTPVPRPTETPPEVSPPQARTTSLASSKLHSSRTRSKAQTLGSSPPREYKALPPVPVVDQAQATGSITPPRTKTGDHESDKFSDPPTPTIRSQHLSIVSAHASIYSRSSLPGAVATLGPQFPSPPGTDFPAFLPFLARGIPSKDTAARDAWEERGRVMSASPASSRHTSPHRRAKPFSPAPPLPLGEDRTLLENDRSLPKPPQPLATEEPIPGSDRPRSAPALASEGPNPEQTAIHAASEGLWASKSQASLLASTNPRQGPSIGASAVAHEAAARSRLPGISASASANDPNKGVRPPPLKSLIKPLAPLGRAVIPASHSCIAATSAIITTELTLPPPRDKFAHPPPPPRRIPVPTALLARHSASAACVTTPSDAAGTPSALPETEESSKPPDAKARNRSHVLVGASPFELHSDESDPVEAQQPQLALPRSDCDGAISADQDAQGDASEGDSQSRSDRSVTSQRHRQRHSTTMAKLEAASIASSVARSSVERIGTASPTSSRSHGGHKPQLSLGCRRTFELDRGELSDILGAAGPGADGGKDLKQTAATVSGSTPTADVDKSLPPTPRGTAHPANVSPPQPLSPEQTCSGDNDPVVMREPRTTRPPVRQRSIAAWDEDMPRPQTPRSSASSYSSSSSCTEVASADTTTPVLSPTQLRSSTDSNSYYEYESCSDESWGVGSGSLSPSQGGARRPSRLFYTPPSVSAAGAANLARRANASGLLSELEQHRESAGSLESLATGSSCISSDGSDYRADLARAEFARLSRASCSATLLNSSGYAATVASFGQRSFGVGALAEADAAARQQTGVGLGLGLGSSMLSLASTGSPMAPTVMLNSDSESDDATVTPVLRAPRAGIIPASEAGQRAATGDPATKTEDRARRLREGFFQNIDARLSHSSFDGDVALPTAAKLLDPLRSAPPSGPGDAPITLPEVSGTRRGHASLDADDPDRPLRLHVPLRKRSFANLRRMRSTKLDKSKSAPSSPRRARTMTGESRSSKDNKYGEDRSVRVTLLQPPEPLEDEVFSVSRPPSQRRLWEASTCFLRDEEGKLVPFGELFPRWSDDGPAEERKGPAPRTIVFFIRHFWCGMCQDYTMWSISRLDPEMLAAHNIRVAVVGCGSWTLLKTYKRLFRCPFPCYTDSPQRLYALMGMIKRAGIVQPPSTRAMSYNKGSVLTQPFRGMRTGWQHMRDGTDAGDWRQLGGEFVLGPEYQCLFAHRMTYMGNHMAATEVLRHAGLDEVAVAAICARAETAHMDREIETWREERAAELDEWNRERATEIERTRRQRAEHRGTEYVALQSRRPSASASTQAEWTGYDGKVVVVPAEEPKVQVPSLAALPPRSSSHPGLSTSISMPSLSAASVSMSSLALRTQDDVPPVPKRAPLFRALPNGSTSSLAGLALDNERCLANLMTMSLDVAPTDLPELSPCTPSSCGPSSACCGAAETEGGEVDDEDDCDDDDDETNTLGTADGLGPVEPPEVDAAVMDRRFEAAMAVEKALGSRVNVNRAANPTPPRHLPAALHLRSKPGKATRPSARVSVASRDIGVAL